MVAAGNLIRALGMLGLALIGVLLAAIFVALTYSYEVLYRHAGLIALACAVSFVGWLMLGRA